MNKMLYTLVFCALVSFAIAQRPIRPKDQQFYYLSPQVLENVKKFSVPCIEKTNADPDIFRKLIDGTMLDDDVSKDFLICFAVSGKFTDEEGHFNIKRMSSMIGNHPLIEPFEAALAECNKVTKENPRETVYEMSLCINEKAPVAFAI